MNIEKYPQSGLGSNDTPLVETWNFITVNPLDGLGVTITETPLSELGAYKTALWLPKVFLPILVVAGVIGNLLTLATLYSKSYGVSPSTVGLTLLTGADTCSLIGNLRWWTCEVYNVDFRMLSAAACRFHKMWTYFFRHLSSCTLAFITLERAVCVCFPIRWKTTFTTRKNIMFTGAMALILFGINLQIPFKYSLEFWPNSNKTECNMYVSEKTWYETVWIPLDQTLHTFLPSSIVLIGNIIIILRLRCQPDIGGDNSERHRSITVMLVAVSIVFLLTTLPSAFFYLGDAHGAWPDNTNQQNADVTLAHTSTMLLARLNNAINFLLYCVTGSKFRNAFLATFLPKRTTNKARNDHIPLRNRSNILGKSGTTATRESEVP